MPTKQQLNMMREVEFEHPETRRTDDPMHYVKRGIRHKFQQIEISKPELYWRRAGIILDYIMEFGDDVISALFKGRNYKMLRMISHTTYISRWYKYCSK